MSFINMNAPCSSSVNTCSVTGSISNPESLSVALICSAKALASASVQSDCTITFPFGPSPKSLPSSLRASALNVLGRCLSFICSSSSRATAASFSKRAARSFAAAAILFASAALLSASEMRALDSILYFSKASSLSLPAFQENPHPSAVTTAKSAPTITAIIPNQFDHPDHHSSDTSSGDIFVWVGSISGLVAVASFLSLADFMIWTGSLHGCLYPLGIEPFIFRNINSKCVTCTLCRIVIQDAYLDGNLPPGENATHATILPAGYTRHAKEIAERRVALAGYRLADEIRRTIR
jgi:hypothetical protein